MGCGRKLCRQRESNHMAVRKDLQGPVSGPTFMDEDDRGIFSSIDKRYNDGVHPDKIISPTYPALSRFPNNKRKQN